MLIAITFSESELLGITEDSCQRHDDLTKSSHLKITTHENTQSETPFPGAKHSSLKSTDL